MGLAIGLALTSTWLGLGIAYYTPYPIGFWVTTIAFAIYLAARALGAVPRQPRWRYA
jgi:zinc/manganese transport system permease protein